MLLLLMTSGSLLAAVVCFLTSGKQLLIVQRSRCLKEDTKCPAYSLYVVRCTVSLLTQGQCVCVCGGCGELLIAAPRLCWMMAFGCRIITNYYTPNHNIILY